MAVTHVSLSPLQRRLIPGLSDLLFLALFLTQLGPRLFRDGDTGWHLWAGNEVLNHGPRMLPDSLSWTRAGVPWRDVQWLGDLLMALLHRHGGYLGVALLVSLVFAATFAWAYRIVLRDTGHAPAALTTTLLAAMVASLHLAARPLVFALPLLLAAWELTRRPEAERRAIWLLPLLTVVWANLHPTAFLAPALAALMGLAGRRSRALALAAVLSALALGATPWGYSGLAEALPGGAGAGLLARIDEWRAPDFSQTRFLFVLAMLVVSVAARSAGGPLRRGEALVGLLCLLATLRSARLAPLAAILWAPRLGEDLAAWARERGGGPLGSAWRSLQDGLAPFERAWRPGLWPAMLGALALIFAPALTRTFPAAAAGFPGELFPRAAMEEARRLGLGPRVFNDYDWGGFVAFEHGDRWKVFIDGRVGLFGPAVLRDYLEVYDVGPGWLQALERHRPDWLLMRSDATLVSVAPLSGRWQVAWSDSVAAILTPRAAPARGSGR
jgi:hypothetical protein